MVRKGWVYRVACLFASGGVRNCVVVSDEGARLPGAWRKKQWTLSRIRLAGGRGGLSVWNLKMGTRSAGDESRGERYR